MGLWFLLNVIVFLGAGSAALYAHFQSTGLPKAPADFINSTVLTAVFLLFTTFGLLSRRTGARAAAVGICFWIAFAPAALYLGPLLPATQDFTTGLNIFRALAPTTPVLLATLFQQTILTTLLCLLFALKSLQTFLSAGMDEAVGAARPAAWKMGAATLALGLFLFTDHLMPGHKPQAPLKAKVPAATPARVDKINPRVAAPARYSDAEVMTAEAGLNGRGVRACRISLDESRLLLVSSDGQAHVVDLRSGRVASYQSKIATRNWPASFADPHTSPIGPDADMYFDSDRNMVLRFSDPKYRYPIGGGANEFISFTSSPQQIIVYNRDSRTLRRIELPLGTVIWTLRLTAPANMPAWTSADFTRMIFTVGGKRITMVGMRDGRSMEVPGSFESIRRVQFGKDWVRLSGLSQNGESNLLYRTTNGNIAAGAPLPEIELSEVSAERGLYINQKAPVKILTLAGDYAGPELSGDLLFSAVLDPDRYVIAAEDQQPQLTLVDLDTKLKSGVGKMHNLRFTKNSTCFTVSSTKRIFAVSVGDQVEIFWSAFLAADQFRSVVLTLPIK